MTIKRIFEHDDEDHDFRRRDDFTSEGGYLARGLNQRGFCNHWRQRVVIGRFTITCSGEAYSKGTKGEPKPDFGVYLDKSWQGHLSKAWTNGSYLKRLVESRPYPAMVYDWPDFQPLPPDELNKLVEICLSKMRRGLQVDIGCIHGHGRTGTLLACLIARIEHLDGRQAVASARARYCRSACESQRQEQAVVEYVKKYVRRVKV